MASDTDEGGFLSRWSRRKAQLRSGQGTDAPDAAAPPTAAAAASGTAAPAQAVDTASPVRPPASTQAEPPPPTLDDVAALTRDSDYTRFVAPGVDSPVKNAALKKLFTDPHFNVMDGLDTYIDDYGRPDPLPAGMLRQMAQSAALGLFSDDPPAVPPEAPASLPTPVPATPTPDEDAALRLQPHDAAGPAGAGLGAEPDPGRQP